MHKKIFAIAVNACILSVFGVRWQNLMIYLTQYDALQHDLQYGIEPPPIMFYSNTFLHETFHKARSNKSH